MIFQACEQVKWKNLPAVRMSAEHKHYIFFRKSIIMKRLMRKHYFRHIWISACGGRCGLRAYLFRRDVSEAGNAYSVYFRRFIMQQGNAHASKQRNGFFKAEIIFMIAKTGKNSIFGL